MQLLQIIMESATPFSVNAVGRFASAFDPSTTADDASAFLAVGSLSLGLLGIMMLIDLFTIPGQLKKQEERVRNDLLVRLVSN